MKFLGTNRRKLRRLKLFILVLIASAILMYFFKLLRKTSSDKKLFKVTLPKVIVHLDLKGAPPTLTYLESFLKKIKGLGANGLLVEYEDMFPYEDTIVNLSKPYHYNRYQLKKFLVLAVELDFEVIPFVQTFGHMEFALKQKEYNLLRENPHEPDSICPSKNESLILIKEMLKQIIEFHQSIAPLHHIHIGCDEVLNINDCKDCLYRRLNDMEIFFEHVNAVAKEVKKLSPRTTVLIWDDMFRNMKPTARYEVSVPKNVEPVCWDYSRYIKIQHTSLWNYHKYFPNIWIASAFKGADGSEAVTPNILNRFRNNLSWMDFIFDYRFAGETKVYTFKGIILTGWSRYSHFQPHCELLPVALPSLILNLIVISTFRNGSKFYTINISNVQNEVINEFRKQLECKNYKEIKTKDLNDINNCYLNLTFPLFHIIHEYTHLVDAIVSHYEQRHIERYLQFGFLLEDRRREIFTRCKKSYKTFKVLEEEVKEKMQLYFVTNVINEYLFNKSYAVYNSLIQCFKLYRPSSKLVQGKKYIGFKSQKQK